MSCGPVGSGLSAEMAASGLEPMVDDSQRPSELAIKAGNKNTTPSSALANNANMNSENRLVGTKSLNQYAISESPQTSVV